MKNTFLKKISVLALGLLLFAPACTNLDEELFDTVTDKNFLLTEEEQLAAMGQAYTSLQALGNHANIWSISELASDELVVTTKGGDWYDGGVLIQLHKHEFTADNGFFNNAWGSIYGGINTCNRLLYQFKSLGLPDELLAELRAVRALWYFYALDAFGNVPLVIDYEDVSIPSNEADFQTGRTKVFNFVESELLAVMPLLSTSTGTDRYGRMNQAAANALLTKLYLNAEVYTGTPQWQKTIDAADAVIASGFSLMASYKENFAIDNTGSTENIFVVPYDRVYAGGFQWVMMTLSYASSNTYSLTSQPWNGYAVVEEFYNSYVDPAQNPGPQGDVWTGLAVAPTTGTVDNRLSNFVVGPQYNADGTRTEDPGFEGASSAAPDPDGILLNFTPQNNEIHPNGWRQGGARIGKYEYEKGGSNNMSNDFVVLRYADVLLAKAEALWRLNAADPAALAIVNSIRTRAGVDTFAALDANNLYAERGREMFAELTRRQDQIRFGTWGAGWWEKAVSGPTYEIFPIPQIQIDANSSLHQNPNF
ncbi:MAG: RagB/SusD family nutrient uptake outer membrane protein [Cyclobacteriaceae bacterium]|nr:RagB/SusD family nutrient uptake outer membrane protein [Cyclobacteriaceae bacterium]